MARERELSGAGFQPMTRSNQRHLVRGYGQLVTKRAAFVPNLYPRILKPSYTAHACTEHSSRLDVLNLQKFDAATKSANQIDSLLGIDNERH